MLRDEPSITNSSLREAVRFRLSQTLARFPSALLSGSWATNDGHVPASSTGLINSFSDVDVVTWDKFSDFDISLLSNAIRSAALHEGIEILKVSVRHRAEIEALWNPSSIDTFRHDFKSAGAFIAFWALVGAAEAARTQDWKDASAASSYIVSKFFFKHFRNVLLLKGIQTKSYRELAWAIEAKLFRDSVVRRSFNVKIGVLSSLAHSDIKLLLSDELWRSSIYGHVDREAADVLDRVRTDFCNWKFNKFILNANDYLRECERFILFPAMERAYAKAVRDASEDQDSPNY